MTTSGGGPDGLPLRRVPKRFYEATLSSLDPKMFAEVLQWAATVSLHLEDGKGLLLSGPPGVGKTWAVTALVRAVCGKVPGLDYEWVTAPDMFENLDISASTWDAFRDQSWDETYSTVHVLVLNDLGKEYRGVKLSEQVAYKLGRVLRARSEIKLVTLVTTNLHGKGMTEAYGESISSLLSELVIPVTVNGPDRRRGA